MKSLNFPSMLALAFLLSRLSLGEVVWLRPFFGEIPECRSGMNKFCPELSGSDLGSCVKNKYRDFSSSCRNKARELGDPFDIPPLFSIPECRKYVGKLCPAKLKQAEMILCLGTKFKWDEVPLSCRKKLDSVPGLKGAIPLKAD